MKTPILYIVIPCYNEETVLPVSAPLFLKKLTVLIEEGKIHDDSRVMFVNSGSKDNTLSVIRELCNNNKYFIGLSLSRNQSQQCAMLAGLSEAQDKCDITITTDCDGQDDLNAIDAMVDEYMKGNEVVYGVRSSRKSDTFFKRNTALAFYKFMNWLGVDTVYNHSEYRLMSSRAVKELLNYKEVNLFLRGLVPLMGFKSSCVYHERHERIAGETKYSFKKLLSIAIDGITSFSIKPIRFISLFGLFLVFFSFIGIIWAIASYCQGSADGWPSLMCVICFLGGVQLTSLGVIGEYVGKIYMETKARPKFIITERLYD